MPSHLPPAACLGGKELMGPVPVPRPAHWTVTEAQGDCCTGFRSGVGGGDLKPSCLFCVPGSCKCVIVSKAIYLC